MVAGAGFRWVPLGRRATQVRSLDEQQLWLITTIGCCLHIRSTTLLVYLVPKTNIVGNKTISLEEAKSLFVEGPGIKRK